GQVLAPAILALAQSLQLVAIAEGVETQEQWQALRALGCDCAQGYLFSPPIPVEELAAVVAQRGLHLMGRVPRSRRGSGLAISG
ncbi:MAG: hypothetical protein QOE64_2227, partial [Frankiales bacterium]|nr:hypothetical protein [Frankiales bacterium]